MKYSLYLFNVYYHFIMMSFFLKLVFLNPVYVCMYRVFCSKQPPFREYL